MVKTQEQFPDLDDLADDKPKKGGAKKNAKKGGPAKDATPKKEEEIDTMNPWKGKPSSFFVMGQAPGPVTDPSNPNNFVLNDDQWSFVFLNYPEYGGGPYDLMTWLFA